MHPMLRVMLAYAAGGGGSPGGPGSATVTVASGSVASDLTDFPLYIDLAKMPAGFWAGTNAGADLRAHIGGTELAVDLVHIDTGAQTGCLFVKVPTLAAAADTEITLSWDGTSSAPDVADPNGRNAVWADYEAVMMFAGDLVNRTGKGDLGIIAGSPLAYTNTVLGAGLDTTARNTNVGASNILVSHTSYTLAATMQFSAASSSTALGLGYAPTATANAGRVNIGRRNGNTFTTYNYSGLYLTGGVCAADTLYRIHGTYDQSGSPHAKQLFVDGALVASTTAHTIPTETRDSVQVGAADGSVPVRGVIGFAYIRGGVLSADWIAAEWDMIDDADFATVA